MNIDFAKIFTANLILLTAILTGFGYVLKESKPEESDKWYCKLLKAENWAIYYYILPISLVNTFIMQFYPVKGEWFILGQFAAVFSMYGYEIFKWFNKKVGK